jgi:hypothetical protein
VTLSQVWLACAATLVAQSAAVATKTRFE